MLLLAKLFCCWAKIAAGAEFCDAAPPAEPLDRVKELDELREQGILTQEEFAAEKKKLLGI